MRAAPLTVIKGGINRLRVKGGAKADSLYDLVNAYVTDAHTVRVRPGTRRDAELSLLTRGLCAFNGSLHTFCHVSVEVPNGYTLHILAHPDSAEGYEIALKTIHFSEPMMGALYVVAEFEDGAVFHYWLQDATAWVAETHYLYGALAQPTVPNGLVYRATRLGDPYPSWTPNTPRFDGIGDYPYAQSIIEPTVYNDFFYECVSAVGSNPRSGGTEPTWPTEDGAQVIEEADSTTETVSPNPPPPPPADVPSPGIIDRYGNSETQIP